MKKLFIFLFLISALSCGSKSDSVYICTGPYAKAYHNDSECRGILACKSDIIGNEINILRIKTGVSIRVKLEPEAKTILERYKGDKYLLNIMEIYGNYEDFRRRLNRSLKQEFPYISIYWARHSWATYAAELDVTDPIIDMAMGHKLKGMSAIYISRNRNKVTEANRKVIDYVLNV